MGQGGIGAALRIGNRRVKLRQRLHMGFVDHGLPEGTTDRRDREFGQVGGRHHAARHEGRAVAPVDLVLALEAPTVPVEGIVPTDPAMDLARIGVENELRRIEAVTVGRVPGAVHPVAVELAGNTPRR